MGRGLSMVVNFVLINALTFVIIFIYFILLICQPVTPPLYNYFKHQFKKRKKKKEKEKVIISTAICANMPKSCVLMPSSGLNR